jgi:superkiller protein 8
VTSNQILSASGASSLKIHSTADAAFPLVQSLDGAHKVGCHHVVTSRNGLRAASSGFGGDLRLWSCQDGAWVEEGDISGSPYVLALLIWLHYTNLHVVGIGKADVWAIALSEDGQSLCGTTHDGHIKVWDLRANGEQIRDFETKGSFGTCVDMVLPRNIPLSWRSHILTYCTLVR